MGIRRFVVVAVLGAGFIASIAWGGETTGKVTFLDLKNSALMIEGDAGAKNPFKQGYNYTFLVPKELMNVIETLKEGDTVAIEFISDKEPKNPDDLEGSPRTIRSLIKK